jgi:enediyne polyketide synthase
MVAPLIAVVGMACRYPDASSPAELWENVLARRRAFRLIPAERLRVEDYVGDSGDPDSIVVRQAALIEGYEFDRVKFRVPEDTFKAVDLVHWLALDIADQTLSNAGFPSGCGLPKDTTGVIVGNTLGGELSRAHALRLRWPYVRRVVEAKLVSNGSSNQERQALIGELERLFKAPFQDPGVESLAGALSNTIAGRIAGYFGFRGGAYAIDGACSSSLLAVTHACTALRLGTLDAVLVGGVDLSLDPFELVGFSRLGALSRDGMRIYDRDPTGFLPGEGCGFVLLMRHDDVSARGNRCYSLIRGFGVSSDGGGGITRPDIEGQILALQRAYADAGYGVETVALFEGHGTGTAIGDEVELRALSAVRRAAVPGMPGAAIGSIKGNIGHTKAAAGIAGLIKASMAVHSQIMPPTTGTEHPHAIFEQEHCGLRVLDEGMHWPGDLPLRAGISSFGFGGINVHVALEGPTGTRRNCLTIRETMLLSTAQDAELILLTAEEQGLLDTQIEKLERIAPRLSYAQIGDLAASVAHTSKPSCWRAAIVTSSPEQLIAQLSLLRRRLAAGETTRLDAASGTFLGYGEQTPRIAFLFPGQASPVRLHGGAMARRFNEVRSIYDDLLRNCDPADVHTTAIAQLAIVAAELVCLRVLESLGMRATVAVGHSLGELTALHWAGCLDEQALQRLVALRGKIMAEFVGEGAMAAVGVSAREIEPLLEGEEGVVVGAWNSSDQVVISGEPQGVEHVVAKARRRGSAASLLPVSRAFHSPLMSRAGEEFGAHLQVVHFRPPHGRVVSTVTGKALAPHENVKDLLKTQFTAPVRFTDAIRETACEADLIFEIGPGEALSHLAAANVSVPVFPLDAAGASLRSLFLGIAAAYVMGVPLNSERLFANRVVRPFDADRELQFLRNPCETAPVAEGDKAGAYSSSLWKPINVRRVPERSPPQIAEPHKSSPVVALSALELLRQNIAHRAQLPLESLKEDSHLVRDLHLNSITVGQIVTECARDLGLSPPVASMQYVNANLGEIAEALEHLRAVGGGKEQQDIIIAGIDGWARPFVAERVYRPLPSSRTVHSSDPVDSVAGAWRVLSAKANALTERLAEALRVISGSGTVVWLSDELDYSEISLLLGAAQDVLKPGADIRRFVVINRGGIANSFARSLYLESQGLTVCTLDLPMEETAVPLIVEEVRVAEGFVEAGYDNEGRRWQQALTLLQVDPESTSLPFHYSDVLLVTGGGKGIAAVCAAALARETHVKLLLIGRSKPDDDVEVADNLKRLATLGINYHYVSADVTRLDEVKRAVAEGEAALGTVTAVLHGAGINQPGSIQTLDTSECLSTVRVKIDGLRNVLAAINPAQLHVLVTFSSIIGRLGMHGEAHYALANAWLSRETERFQAQHPSCRCVALEWSIWSGVGMGERLGRIDALLREGITPIPPDTGIAWLRHLIGRRLPAVSIIVSGRLGRANPLCLHTRSLPFRRFLERPVVYYPGVELIVDVELSNGSDPYLEHHVFQGQRLFPAVMALEAMAQVSMALADTTSRPMFEHVRFDYPIVIRDKPLLIRIAALVRDSRHIDVAVRSAESEFQVDHVTATCIFQDCDLAEAVPSYPTSNVALEPMRDLYGRILFQQGSFARLRKYSHLDAFSAVAEIDASPERRWFARYLPQDLVLSDAGSRDSCIHAIQACIPDSLLLPVGVDRILFSDENDGGAWTVRAKERTHKGPLFTYDLDILTARGSIRECWEGLRLRKVADTAPQAWPPALLGSIVERGIKGLVPGAAIALVFEHSNGEPRSLARTAQAFRHLFHRDIALHHRYDGCPEIDDPSTISASHAGEWTMVVAGRPPIACDIEELIERSDRTWRDLLGRHYDLAEVLAHAIGEGKSQAATRVWTAIECLVKSGAGFDTPLSLARSIERGWVLFMAGRAAIISYIVTPAGNQCPLVLAVLVPGEHYADKPTVSIHTGEE